MKDKIIKILEEFGVAAAAPHIIDELADRLAEQSEEVSDRKSLEKLYKRMVGHEEMHDSDEYFMDEITKIFQSYPQPISEEEIEEILHNSVFGVAANTRSISDGLTCAAARLYKELNKQ